MTWTNPETECVARHIDSAADMRSFWTQRARGEYKRAARCAAFSKAENATFALSNALEEYYTGRLPDNLGGTLFDLLVIALNNVDWEQLANHYLKDVVEDKGRKVRG